MSRGKKGVVSGEVMGVRSRGEVVHEAWFGVVELRGDD
jgi:hypothetical protein